MFSIILRFFGFLVSISSQIPLLSLPREVIAAVFPHLDALSTIKFLAASNYLRGLRELVLSLDLSGAKSAEGRIDFGFLRGFPGLRSLNLSSSGFTDISILSRHSFLHSVDLTNTWVSVSLLRLPRDASFPFFKSVFDLKLSSVSDLSFLVHFPNLKTFS